MMCMGIKSFSFSSAIVITILLCPLPFPPFNLREAEAPYHILLAKQTLGGVSGYAYRHSQNKAQLTERGTPAGWGKGGGTFDIEQDLIGLMGPLGGRPEEEGDPPFLLCAEQLRAEMLQQGLGG